MGKIYMRFPGGKHKALTLSYDDGPTQDVRMVEILVKNGLKATFNLNSGLYGRQGRMSLRMPLEQAKELYVGNGMEIALHTLNHPILTYLPENICTYEILQDRINHERDFSCIIRGMAYPEGELSVNDSVMTTLKQCGISYARSTRETEQFHMPTNWLHLHPTAHHRNPRLMELAERFVESNFLQGPGLFYLWGHSYEFDWNQPNNNWSVIEAFAEHMGGRDDIWYATNIEIYDYDAAFKQLQFNVEQTMVYNPTAMTLYFEADNTNYCVHPGELLCLK